MSKSHLSWLAVVLVLAGVAVMTGHPAWGAMTGAVLILVGGAVAVGAGRKSDHHGGPRGQRISNDLVTLSAAAIIAVYAAGFQRTKSAADEFEAQAARRRVHPPATSALGVPKAERLSAQAAQVASAIGMIAPSSTRAPVAEPGPRPGKTGTGRAPLQVQTAVPAPAATEAQQSQSTPMINEPVSAPPASIATDVPAAPAATPATPPATTPAAAPPAAAPDLVMPKLHYRDGTFVAWGRCAHGRIQASVVIKDGRIDSASITQCDTAYPCERISALPGRVVTMQDANVDVVTGASDSSYAFQDAVAAAMFKGQRGE